MFYAVLLKGHLSSHRLLGLSLGVFEVGIDALSLEQSEIENNDIRMKV